ncbi:hypothetical protein PVK06_028187 [Gossypium arboreum]|uniref:Uncharacterized protein n=1 Tax=Gossypium arboreum TaxID=29729 RepID=A0ABR0P2J5_GOSAR|nr:hypothetical protein PVK06_028187 [Gossypium arboreum]
MKEKEEERKQNEVEKENEKEKEFDQKKKVEKEIEVKEISVFKEKDSSGKDVSEQEQVRSVSTNPHVNFSCVVTFQVSKELVNKFQLHYLPKERRFTLVGKGNPSPPVPQGKKGKCYKAFQYPSTYFSVCDYIDDMVNFHSLINGDVFVSNDGKESITNGNCGVDEHVGEVTLDWKLRNLAMRDSECSYKHFNFSDGGDNEHSLTCCAKPTSKKYVSQQEMVRENFIFDPGEYYSISLYKGFESYNVVFRVWIKKLERDCMFLTRCVPNLLLYFVVENLKWTIQKEEGHMTTTWSFQVVCVNQVFVSRSIPIGHQESYNDECFDVNNCLDLRTSHFEDGGMMYARLGLPQVRIKILSSSQKVP